jgi:hypothetical protein
MTSLKIVLLFLKFKKRFIEIEMRKKAQAQILENLIKEDIIQSSNLYPQNQEQSPW